jgi:hypothetical protein
VSWKDEKLEDLGSRSGVLIELDALAPEEMPDESDASQDRGAVVILSDWDGETTMIVETGIDPRGHGFVISSAYDRDGGSIEQNIVSSGDQVMLSTESLDTSVRDE